MSPVGITVAGMASRGRPSKIDQVARIDPDGTQLTASEVVVERVGLGLDYQSAADSAGISRRTLHNWRLNAARLRAAQAQGKTAGTANEQVLIDFLHALEKAEAEAEANRLAIIQTVAEGGGVVTKTTVTKNADGQVTGTTAVTETLRPVWTAAAWWLERRKPGKYARRVQVTGSDAAPLVTADEQARNLADSLRAYQADQAATNDT
jgi:hypothetical protein